MSSAGERGVYYPIGILPPHPIEPPKRPPAGYHPYPFCNGSYNKYCSDPWNCPIGAVWLREEAFLKLHYRPSGVGYSAKDLVGQTLAFKNDFQAAGAACQPGSSLNNPLNLDATPARASKENAMNSNIGARARLQEQVQRTYTTVLAGVFTYKSLQSLQLVESAPSFGPPFGVTPLMNGMYPPQISHRDPDPPIPIFTPNAGIVQPSLTPTTTVKPAPQSPPPSATTPQPTRRRLIFHNTFGPRVDTGQQPPKPVRPPRHYNPKTGTMFGPSPNKPVTCKWEGCDTKFPNELAALDHIKFHHIGSRKFQHHDFTCRIRQCHCGGKTFDKRDNIVSHVTNVAFNIRYAVCPYQKFGCPVALKREWDLPRHSKCCKFNPDNYKGADGKGVGMSQGEGTEEGSGGGEYGA
ncbi:hypothetical protein ABW19_dt0209358 [Dactylella cylindrospora]|nr:hypothetical protein ABW19_dt0209358 [Dactylella cylindrospora]